MKNKYYSLLKDNDTTQVKINSVPTLYRYQTINEYSVSALLKNELWGTVPTAFNDPYDMIICYSAAIIKKELKKKLASKNIGSYMAFLDVHNKNELLNKILGGLLDEYNDNIRKQYCVSCFSETVESEIMWGHYANCSKGFVIAYDGDQLSKIAISNNHAVYSLIKELKLFDIDLSKYKEDNLTTLAPVIYSGGKTNCSKELIKMLDDLLNYYDALLEGKTISSAASVLYKEAIQKYYSTQEEHNNQFYSALCNKNKEWDYEKEWRIWSYNRNMLSGQINNPHVLIGNNAFAKAIYLGEKISEYDEIALMEIARLNKLPVYKMKTHMYKNRCALKAELLRDFD